MTSSLEMRASISGLPPALSSVWRLCKLGYQHEPRLIVAAFVLALVAALPDALLAVWLKLMGEGAMQGDWTRVRVAAIALGVSAAATWILNVVSTRVQRRFRDKVTVALESHVARLLASIATIAHHERREYLDRLAVLRNQVFVLDHMYMSLLSTCSWMLRLGVTIVLLASIHPALMLLVLFAIPTVLTSTWRPAVERIAYERGAQSMRLARHLFDTATTATAGKDVRVTGIGDRLVRERRDAWALGNRGVAAARWGSAGWHVMGWAIFGLAYVGAIAFVASALRAPAGDVLLTLAAGARLSFYVGATVGEIGFLRGIWMDGAKRLAWLEDYARSLTAHADQPSPDRLVHGIRFEHVSFAYPGTERRVLDDINLELPAGSVVAIVGENGAGKSTLVKLLTKMYEPDGGRILIDQTDLSRIAPTDWRVASGWCVSGFFPLRIPRRSHGWGWRSASPRPAAGGRRSRRSGRRRRRDRTPARSAGNPAGQTWPGGVELSFGQWQKLALARGFMRDRPVVLVLDEPTAALDAETEHALFERYQPPSKGAAARAASRFWCHTGSRPCGWPISSW